MIKKIIKLLSDLNEMEKHERERGEIESERKICLQERLDVSRTNCTKILEMKIGE
jgi:hypothetical protein